MIDDDEPIEALKALAHPLRFRILTSLAGAERNVGELEQVTGITQPGLSQQLGVLRKAGLVDTRKDAKLVYYTIADTQIVAVLNAISAFVPKRAERLGAETQATTVSAPGAANFARMF